MRSAAGFTLIEIMVVVLIIAGLASLVGVKVIGQLCRSRAVLADPGPENADGGDGIQHLSA